VSSQSTAVSDNLNAGWIMMNIKEVLGSLVVDAGCGAFNIDFLLAGCENDMLILIHCLLNC
jgi:hypothetical protein